MERDQMKDATYEMILCIINAGHAATVMEAATRAGAGGGTIIRGRGTADPEAEQFFGISVSPDKEILMILVPGAIRDDVMKAVYHAAGLDRESQGIAFSLPVDEAVGLRQETDRP